MIAYILIAAGIFSRLLPHAHNMVPVGAIAIFAGASLSRKQAPWVPLAIMAVSDLIIGLHGVVLFTWGAFLLAGYMGNWLREKRTPGRIFGTSVLAALSFYIVTNFGVWLLWYPHTAAGLTDCFIKAIPFFRNTMASTVLFSFAFFGVYELARRAVAGSKYADLLLFERA